MIVMCERLVHENDFVWLKPEKKLNDIFLTHQVVRIKKQNGRMWPLSNLMCSNAAFKFVNIIFRIFKPKKDLKTNCSFSFLLSRKKVAGNMSFIILANTKLTKLV